MKPEERRLLEGLFFYQKHIGENLTLSLESLAECAKQYEQATLVMSEVTSRFGAICDRLEQLEERIGAYISDQVKQENKVQALREELKRYGERQS